MKTTIVAGTNVTTTTTNTNVATTTNVATSIPSITITPKVETSEGTIQQFQTPIGTAPIANSSSPNNITNKRPISLDLNKSATAKKQRLVTPLIVDSPDLQNMKTLNTPDLEKILLASNMLQTPQPGLVFPTKIGAVTSEQEAFGKGFEEALHSLHNSKNSQQVQSNTSTINNNNVVVGTAAVTAAAGVTTTSTATAVAASTVGTGMSGGSFVYTNLENFPVAIKDEPQNPPSPTAVSPIDMETQEKIKLERKRQRNRVAASKCRKRKLERISKLEDKVKQLKFENTDLGAMVKTLKDVVAQLKQQVMEHIGSGCSINEPNNGITLLQGK